MAITQISEQLTCIATKEAGIGPFCTLKRNIGACGGDGKDIPPCQTGVLFLRNEVSKLSPGTRTQIFANVMENPFISILEAREISLINSKIIKSLRFGAVDNK